jgi:Icc protein
VRLVQLSDTHLLSAPNALLWDRNPTDNLTGMVATLSTLPGADALVISGDLSEDGSEAAYRRVDALTERIAPRRYVLPGNHDDVDEMTQVFGDVADTRRVELSDAWMLVLVNSQWTGNEAGELTDDSLDRLCEELDQLDRHAVLSLHHPPISPCPNPDCGLLHGDRLVRALLGTRVRVVLSGHVHQHFEVRRDGITFVGAPSTLSQLEHGGAPHYTETDDPPAALVIDLADDGTIAHHVVQAEV